MYWYNIIFPPQPFRDTSIVVLHNETIDEYSETLNSEDPIAWTESAEYVLYISSVSLALGLILGLTAVRFSSFIFKTILRPFRNCLETEDGTKNLNSYWKNMLSNR